MHETEIEPYMGQAESDYLGKYIGPSLREGQRSIGICKMTLKCSGRTFGKRLLKVKFKIGSLSYPISYSSIVYSHSFTCVNQNMYLTFKEKLQLQKDAGPGMCL